MLKYTNNIFDKRRLVIGTKHHKEKVISPLIEEKLGVKSFIPNDFDTDELGTFSGEIERKNDPLSTVRSKCLMAMKLSGCDLSIASEGSFGPHPTLFFIPADDEILMLIDNKNKLEIVAREISTDTNFSGQVIANKIQLKEFAEKIKFPSHGLIAKKSQNDFTDIEKGIMTWDRLFTVFDYFSTKYNSFYLETDMRAMYNPTRMKVIEKAAIKLTEKINCLCPKCHTPGFGVVDFKKGLPCDSCKFPTNSTLSFIHKCQKCNYKIEQKYPHGKKLEDPMFCDRCNP